MASSSVVQEAGHRRGEAVEVVGIDQQTVALVDDLVLDPADATGDHRPRLSHRFGDGQPEPLDEALLHDEVGVAL